MYLCAIICTIYSTCSIETSILYLCAVFTSKLNVGGRRQRQLQRKTSNTIPNQNIFVMNPFHSYKLFTSSV
jgi:hypothetical protein